MADLLLKAEGITKVYHRGSEVIRAVDGVDVEMHKGEIISFVGPSGSGKTTLLHILGCLDNPTSGRLGLMGRTVFDDGKALSERELTMLRRQVFGYVFQKFYLVPTLTVFENVVLPSVFSKEREGGRAAEELLALLGMGGRKDHRPGQISGGEMQRAAIARALVSGPAILLADEPTGNLDSKRTEEIKDIFLRLNREKGVALLMVTHNKDLAKISHRVLELRDGRVVG